MRVVVLGAGFGGLELCTLLSVFSAEIGGDVEVVLIDKAKHFVFGYSKLDVMFARTVPVCGRRDVRPRLAAGRPHARP